MTRKKFEFFTSSSSFFPQNANDLDEEEGGLCVSRKEGGLVNRRGADVFFLPSPYFEKKNENNRPAKRKRERERVGGVIKRRRPFEKKYSIASKNIGRDTYNTGKEVPHTNLFGGACLRRFVIAPAAIAIK